MGKNNDVESVLEEPSSRLEKPLQLEDLINKCSDFTIRSMDEEEIERREEMDITQVYSPEELEPYCLTEVLEPASDDDEDADVTYDDISRSFPIFRKKMHKITEDGKVMKMIDQGSNCEKVPDEGNVIVYIHYAAYVEFVENPFDCTRLRQKKPIAKKLGVGEVIPGLEISLRSMRKGEKSKFLIHPDLAFREKGIPPRIPPQATILFDIELIDICEFMPDEELKARDRTFAQSLIIARKLRDRGNKLKKLEKNLNGAISAYRKGLEVLIQASFNNDEDEEIRKKELLHFYSNLAVCHLENKRYKLVCSMYNDACTDCHPLASRHVKLLYTSGKALKILGSFDEALRRLRKAIKLKPADESILRELEAVSKARKDYLESEKHSCRRIFGFTNLNEEPSQIDDGNLQTVDEEFKTAFLEGLNYFLSSNRTTEKHNGDGYTYAEKQFIRKVCAEKNLLFKTTTDNAILIIKRSV